MNPIIETVRAANRQDNTARQRQLQQQADAEPGELVSKHAVIARAIDMAAKLVKKPSEPAH